MQTFTTIFHPTDNRMRDIYGLRYKVYCEERRFENPSDFPDGIETDGYDENAVHFATFRNNKIIGTARIILNTGGGFPLEKHAWIDADIFNQINRDNIGEISRLAFSKDYRKHLPHRLTPDYHNLSAPLEKMHSAETRYFESMTMIRLYRSIFIECRRKNLTHLIAIMADGLCRLLNKNGIIFTPIGPPVHYHGVRKPCICNIERTMHLLKKNYPAIYSQIVS